MVDPRCAHGVPATDPCEACAHRCANIPGADDPLPGEYLAASVACPHAGGYKCFSCAPPQDPFWQNVRQALASLGDRYIGEMPSEDRSGLVEAPQASYCIGACNPMMNWRLEGGVEICQCDRRHPYHGRPANAGDVELAAEGQGGSPAARAIYALTSAGAIAQPGVVTDEMVDRALTWYREHFEDDLPGDVWMRGLLEAAWRS